jgi:hypothetical protein
LEGTQVRDGIYGLYLDPTYRPPEGAPNSGNRYHLEENLAAAPQLFATHTFERLPLTLGLGVYAPFGASASWPDDTGFRTVATKGSLTYYEGWQSRSERRAEFFLKSGLCLFSFSGGSGFSKRDPGL